MVAGKSTLTVAWMPLRPGRDALPDYARPKGPKKFTQPQLVACRLVKELEGKAELTPYAVRQGGLCCDPGGSEFRGEVGPFCSPSMSRAFRQAKGGRG